MLTFIRKFKSSLANMSSSSSVLATLKRLV
jgi:hypothetical protein